ncbi:MAG: pantetheine-phosphate adenylyltransferase [Candidatus Sericytochromatia bacterium]|nr:pantetheine-phosphate adenylyltransferase [Candidatus Sericytochromatia bacterium]
MRKALYPGSFDPVTNGHIDIMQRACKLFDEVLVVVSQNIAKRCTFTAEERVEMIQQSTHHLPNLQVMINDGLIAECARKQHAQAIIRGLRAVSDFEIELKMALMNKHLNQELETVFLMTQARYLFLNSSLIREVAAFHGDIADFVPAYVVECLRKKYNENEL